MVEQNFKPIHQFKVMLSGRFACFTDPLFKVERTSYPAPTAGSLEYAIGRIYWHPNIQYRIDKIYILNPLKYEPIMLNERADVGDVNLRTGDITYVRSANAFQRDTTYLYDVRYVVEFTMFYDRNYYKRMKLPVHPEESAKKHIEILSRRIRSGECQYTPVFGLGDCVADFEPVTEDFKACENINLTYNSLYKVIHCNEYDNVASFTMVKIRKGVLDFSHSRIVVGNDVMTQDELINTDWRK